MSRLAVVAIGVTAVSVLGALGVYDRDRAGTARGASTTVSAASGWSYLERMGEANAGQIGGLAATRIGARRVVTAVRNGSGNLEVIAWELQYDGSLKRLGGKDGGPTTDVTLAAVGPGSVVTAARTEKDTLKLTVWVVAADGAIKRLESAETGEIRGEFAVTTFLSDPRPRIVTAVHDATDHLRLISWEVGPFGLLKRLKAAVAERVRQISLATYDSYPPDPGRVATAVTTTAGKLKVIAWSLDADGGFQRLGSAGAGVAKNVVASSLSHKRIVTAARDDQGRLEVRTWDFDAAGKVSPHAVGHAGTITDLDVTALNAARVITSVRDSAGQLKLIEWDAIDNLVRLGDAGAGAVGLLANVVLGSDWLVTPVKSASGDLTLIAWRDHGVSLLRGEWEPGLTLAQVSPATRKLIAKRDTGLTKLPSDERETAQRQVTAKVGEARAVAEPTGALPPAITNVVEPRVEGVDPMIAVGYDKIIVSQDHRLRFFDKNMKPLGGLISSTEFFSTFLEGRLPDGSPNENSIQRHTGFPPKGAVDKYPPGRAVHCDPDQPWPADPPCYDEFFDTRVYFDRGSKRFFVLSVARARKKVGGVDVATIENPLHRRYWAFAVSKSEDPRDGFYQWMMTEAHWTDFPRVTVNGGVLVIEGNLQDYPEPLETHAVGLKPLVYVFSMDDLVKGKPYPRSHKLFPPDFAPLSTNREAIPLAHYGDTGGRTFFVAPQDEVMHVFSFKNPNPSDNWQKFPALERTTASLVVSGTKVPVGSGLLGAFRDGKVYLVWMKKDVAPTPDGVNGLYSIRLVRLPLKSLATKPTASVKAADGFLYRNFGRNAPQDDPDDLVSYERPEITVNSDGHIVIVYGRVGYQTKRDLFPEARYSVYYADERGLRPSRLLHVGEYMPMEVKSGETDQTIETPNDQLDHQFATVDPVDERRVWMISEYARKAKSPDETDDYRTVVGRVTP